MFGTPLSPCFVLHPRVLYVVRLCMLDGLYRVMDTPSWDGRQAPRRLANADSLPPAVKVRLAHGPNQPLNENASHCNTTLQVHSCNTIGSSYVLHVGPDLTRPQPQSLRGLEIGRGGRAAPPRVSVAFFNNETAGPKGSLDQSHSSGVCTSFGRRCCS